VEPYAGVFRSVLLPGWRGCGDRKVYGCWVFVRVWMIAFGIMVWGSFRWLFAAVLWMDVESFNCV